MELRIYLEGGGDTADGRTKLRQGMDGFLKPLKDLARRQRWHWKLIPCKGRSETWDAFQNAREKHTTVMSIGNCRIKSFEFNTRILIGKPPVDLGLLIIPAFLPR
ncbi:MAG: hypothetical protein LBC18_13925, partial [Opitutaceae bacterium]|nr:hypothetical protein [Opitutaceae bacterium]